MTFSDQYSEGCRDLSDSSDDDKELSLNQACLSLRGRVDKKSIRGVFFMMRQGKMRMIKFACTCVLLMCTNAEGR